MKTIILSLIIALAVSCSKDKEAELLNSTLPIVAVTNIFEGQTFTSGQTIPITGTVKDDNAITEIRIRVTNTGSGSLIMEKLLTPAATDVSFSESMTASPGVTYKIEIVATDDAGNVTVLVVNVSGV